jgi:hypothetical protein
VGIGGRVPVNPYVAIDIFFDSVEVFSLRLMEKFADIPNYSNVVGELQISDIV